MIESTRPDHQAAIANGQFLDIQVTQVEFTLPGKVGMVREFWKGLMDDGYDTGTAQHLLAEKVGQVFAHVGPGQLGYRIFPDGQTIQAFYSILNEKDLTAEQLSTIVLAAGEHLTSADYELLSKINQ
jgi:hypothetical protein